MAIAPDQDLGFAGSSTTTVTVSGTFPAGALICVAVGFATATSGQSISQSGSVFTNLFTRENSTTNNLVYWVGYIKNWAGGALSTTFTLSGAGKDAGARLLSFTGADTTAPLVLSRDPAGFTKSTTMDSGAVTGTTNATDLIVGFFTWANTSDISGTITLGTTPASGWNITAHSNGASANTPHGHALFTYQILTSAATNPDASVAFTTPSAGVSWGAQIATFKAAAGGTLFTKTLSVTTLSVPSLTKSVGKNFNVATISVPTLLKQVGKGFGVVTTSVPALLKQVGKGLSVVTASVPTVLKQIGKSLSVTTTSIPSLATAKLKLVLLAVTTTTVPSLSKQIGKAVVVTTVSVPSVTKSIAKTLAVTTLTVPKITKSIAKVLTVTTTTVSSLVTAKLKLVLLAVTTTTIPTLTKRIGKALTVSTTTAPTLTKLIGKTLPVTTTSVPSLTKLIGKALTVATISVASVVAQFSGGLAKFAAKVGIGDLAAFVIAIADNLAFSVGLTDAAASSSLASSDSAAYTVAINDSAVYSVTLSDHTP